MNTTAKRAESAKNNKKAQSAVKVSTIDTSAPKAKALTKAEKAALMAEKAKQAIEAEKAKIKAANTERKRREKEREKEQAILKRKAELKKIEKAAKFAEAERKRRAAQIKAAENIKAMEDKKAALESLTPDARTFADKKRLFSLEYRLEDKTASKIYRESIANKYALELCGLASLPSFAQFLERLPVKVAYSKADGMKALASFNTSAKRAEKAMAQAIALNAKF